LKQKRPPLPLAGKPLKIGDLTWSTWDGEKPSTKARLIIGTRLTFGSKDNQAMKKKLYTAALLVALFLSAEASQVRNYYKESKVRTEISRS